jgi:hypothetical protein
MSKTVHGTKACCALHQSAWWFKHHWHKRYRAKARALTRQAELGGDVVANDFPRMREVSSITESKGDFW